MRQASYGRRDRRRACSYNTPHTITPWHRRTTAGHPNQTPSFSITDALSYSGSPGLSLLGGRAGCLYSLFLSRHDCLPTSPFCARRVIYHSPSLIPIPMCFYYIMSIHSPNSIFFSFYLFRGFCFTCLHPRLSFFILVWAHGTGFMVHTRSLPWFPHFIIFPPATLLLALFSFTVISSLVRLSLYLSLCVAVPQPFVVLSLPTSSWST